MTDGAQEDFLRRKRQNRDAMVFPMPGLAFHAPERRRNDPYPKIHKEAWNA